MCRLTGRAKHELYSQEFQNTHHTSSLCDLNCSFFCFFTTLFTRRSALNDTYRCLSDDKTRKQREHKYYLPFSFLTVPCTQGAHHLLGNAQRHARLSRQAVAIIALAAQHVALSSNHAYHIQRREHSEAAGTKRAHTTDTADHLRSGVHKA